MTLRRPVRVALVAAVAAFAVALCAAPGAGAATKLPEDFEAQTVFSGIDSYPVNFAFAPDGRVFLALKNGEILVYDNLQDKTPEVFANLTKPVYDYEDHGLLGMTLDPKFDEGRPYVYALYTFNHVLANPYTQKPLVTEPRLETPRWPSTTDFDADKCQEAEEVKAKKHEEEGHGVHPPLALEKEGCEVSGVLVRLTASPLGNHAVPPTANPLPGEAKEEVLLEGWCQQSTTHSIGDLGWGPNGELFVSGGEGAMFEKPDYGQFGNLCKDPPTPSTAITNRETALGGSLRSQSVLRKHLTAAEATLLSGSLLRIKPDPGPEGAEGWPGNPFAASSEPNAKRIFAFGFRQPWRYAFNPRTGNIFLDNVGNAHYEEMDRIPLNETAAYNSGWPCYEGGAGQANERNLEWAEEEGGAPLNHVCKTFYEDESMTEAETGYPQPHAPFFAYGHNGPAVPRDPCVTTPPGPTDIGGLAFYEGKAYPKAYRDALFFSDPIRGCLYTMTAAANGEPDPATATTFESGNAAYSFPGIAMKQGPEGNIYYLEFGSGGIGALKRIVYTGPPEREPEKEKEAEKPPASNPPPATSPPASTSTPVPVAPAPPTIRRRPAKKTTRRTAKFVFSGEAGAGYRCKIDNKSFASCRSPRTYKHLRPGKHSFRVYLVDSSGARLSANRTFSWQIRTGS